MNNMKFVKNLFRRITSTKEKQVLLENFLSLSFLQTANYILPLITLPYLVRVLGPEKFGLIAFAQAMTQYFSVFTEYGFNFSATREISICRDNPQKVSNIFNAVIIAKLLLVVVSFLFLAILVIYVPKFRADWCVYFFAFGSVVGSSLFPTWFFQGIERMRYITVLNMIGKLIFTIAIFVFIKTQNDFLYVPLITSLGFIITGLLSLWVVFNKFKIRFVLPNYENIRHQLNEGCHTFISTMSITLYTNTNTFVLGLLTNNTIVGYYSAAEKLISAVRGMLGVISQSVYPYISKIAAESKDSALRLIRELTKIIGWAFFTISVLIFMFAAPIVTIILGPKYHNSIVVLRILSFLPFIIALSNIYAVQGLFAFGRQKTVSKYISMTAVAYVPTMIAMAYSFNQIGTAVSVIIIEIIITLLSRHYYFKMVNEHDI